MSVMSSESHCSFLERLLSYISRVIFLGYISELYKWHSENKGQNSDLLEAQRPCSSRKMATTFDVSVGH